MTDTLLKVRGKSYGRLFSELEKVALQFRTAEHEWGKIQPILWQSMYATVEAALVEAKYSTWSEAARAIGGSCKLSVGTSMEAYQLGRVLAKNRLSTKVYPNGVRLAYRFSKTIRPQTMKSIMAKLRDPKTVGDPKAQAAIRRMIRDDMAGAIHKRIHLAARKGEITKERIIQEAEVLRGLAEKHWNRKCYVWLWDDKNEPLLHV